MTKIVNCYNCQLSGSRKSRQLNLKHLNIVIFLFIIVFGIGYLLNISELTVKGFALRELKIEASNLASEKLEQEEKVNALQSYYSLNARTAGSNMVAVDNIEYLSLSNPVVAKK